MHVSAVVYSKSSGLAKDICIYLDNKVVELNL